MCELRNVTKLEVGYRALPSEVPHPKKARRISKEAFHERRTVMLQSVDGVCAGHLGTEVWHDGSCFLVLVKLEGRDDVVAESICTFTPTFGMAAIDGLFAEDVEDWILHEELGRTSERAGVFDNVDAIAVQTYLSERGFNTEPDQDQQTAVRKWWQFWK